MSLATHVLLFVFLHQLTQLEKVSKKDNTLEIVFNEPEQKNTFVQSSPQKNTKQVKKKKQVKFKSNNTNRVEKETWRRPTPVPIQSSVSSGGKKAKNKEEKKVPKKDKGDLVSSERKPLELPGFGHSSSRPTIPTFVQERLPPGVRLGNVTALNTDQHRFYSFNQRLLSRFVPLWGEQVRRALYSWLSKNSNPVISKTWVTNVEVIMNQKGEILDVKPFRLSGLWSIDQASIESFKQIKNVPNPPKEMVDENGYIHLQFQTEVLYIPQPGVRFHGGN